MSTTSLHTVLVTGGAGFIGSRVIKLLLEDPTITVACLDNFDPVYERSFKEKNITAFRNNPHFSLHECDIRNKVELAQVCAATKPSLILHLAAKADTRDALVAPYPYIETNIIGSLNVFECAREYEVANVVAASSSSVYGNYPELPWSEDMTDLHPLSPYGVTKLAMEHLAYTYHYNFKLNITCIRYFNAYGEHNRPGMVPYKWAKAMLTDREIELSGNGERRRDYTHVDDIARATVLALFKPVGFEVLNVGYGSPLSLNELLLLFERVTNRKAIVKKRESHSASVESTYANTQKAEQLLNWKPIVSHEEGIARLVEWLKENRPI